MTAAETQHKLQHMQLLIARMPPDHRTDVETFATIFRNMLAAGLQAEIAMALVGAELLHKKISEREAAKPTGE